MPTLVRLLKGALAHLVIQGAYLLDHLTHPVICERRLWLQADSSTISVLLELAGTLLEKATGGPGTGYGTLMPGFGVGGNLDYDLVALDGATQGKGKPFSSRKRFDILDLDWATRAAYEIKADTTDEIAKGHAYLQETTDDFNKIADSIHYQEGKTVPHIKAGLWEPSARLLCTGLRSWLDVRLDRPGVLAYKFLGDQSDDTVEELRAAVRDQRIANIVILTIGSIGVGVAAAATIAELSAAAEAAEAVGETGQVIRIEEAIRKGAAAADVVADVQKAASVAFPLKMPIFDTAVDIFRGAATGRPQPFRRPRNYAPVNAGTIWQQQQSASPGSIPTRVQTGPQPGPDAALPGGTPGGYQPGRDASLMKALAEDVVVSLPDSPGHGDSSFDQRVSLLAAWFGSMAEVLGGLPELVRSLGGNSINGKNADLNDPVFRFTLAQNIVRTGSADTSFAILDWLAFAPGDELQDMLALDADT